MHNALKLLPLVAVMALCFPVASAIAADEEHPPAESGEDPAPAAGHGDAEDGHGHGDDHAGHAKPASEHPLSIDPDLAIVTLIIFVVLLIVLRKFAWGPIMEGLAKREQGIADDIDAAAARRKDAEKMLNEYQVQLERAGGEVRAMLDNAKKEAESMKNSIIEEANKAASAEKDRATREIDAAKNSAINEIAEHSVNIAFRVASGAMRREIKADDHRNLIEDALKQFSSDN